MIQYKDKESNGEREIHVKDDEKNGQRHDRDKRDNRKRDRRDKRDSSTKRDKRESVPQTTMSHGTYEYHTPRSPASRGRWIISA